MDKNLDYKSKKFNAETKQLYNYDKYNQIINKA